MIRGKITYAMDNSFFQFICEKSRLSPMRLELLNIGIAGESRAKRKLYGKRAKRLAAIYEIGSSHFRFNCAAGALLRRQRNAGGSGKERRDPPA
jgi:hypothetical protein